MKICFLQLVLVTKGASFCIPGCGCGYGCIGETVDPVTDAVATGDAQGHPLSLVLGLSLVRLAMRVLGGVLVHHRMRLHWGNSIPRCGCGYNRRCTRTPPFSRSRILRISSVRLSPGLEFKITNQISVSVSVST